MLWLIQKIISSWKITSKQKSKLSNRAFPNSGILFLVQLHKTPLPVTPHSKRKLLPPEREYSSSNEEERHCAWIIFPLVSRRIPRHISEDPVNDEIIFFFLSCTRIRATLEFTPDLGRLLRVPGRELPGIEGINRAARRRLRSPFPVPPGRNSEVDHFTIGN